MMPAQNRAAGMNFGFPDVCNTPAGPATVPIPYPNIGMNAQATGFAVVVKVNMVNALHMASTISMTSGDEGGVAHPTVKGTGMFTSGSPKVFVEKIPGTHLGAMATGNSGNCASAAAIVPSSVNVFYTDATPRGVSRNDEGDRWGRHLDAGDVADLAEVAVRTVARVDLDADGTLRVALSSIGHDAGALVDAAIESHAATALELDLRGCGGGALDGGIDLAARFLPQGAPVALVVDRDGDEEVRRARVDGRLDIDILVRVDGGTASAAEICAVALTSHRRATVRGERTAGKGAILQCHPAGAGGVTTSVGEALGPQGERIEGVGVYATRTLLLDSEGRDLAKLLHHLGGHLQREPLFRSVLAIAQRQHGHRHHQPRGLARGGDQIDAPADVREHGPVLLERSEVELRPHLIFQ